ncbi:MAG TPA: lysophospholipid acyltransferase family protein [Mycobacterium sp.]|mgnify:CR=1 FL=1|nr:lysophospholipid acyltransferase family protein [Mycobacterium sp.]
MPTIEHGWFPRTSCTAGCVEAGLASKEHGFLEAVRTVRRITVTTLLLTVLPVLAVPLPGHIHVKRLYCRSVLRCLGVRITMSGGPIRNLRGMLVVSNHVSWVDVFAIGSVLPGTFVARADLLGWPAVGMAARLANVIPIERGSLRELPGVVDAVVRRLRDGHTVVAFPEGTTYCGRDHGVFRPAMFQAAVATGRPVQPLRLSYRHRDGSPSTVTAFLAEDSMWESIKRIVRTRRTVVHIEVPPLELPSSVRTELAVRCQEAVHPQTTSVAVAPTAAA